MKFALYGCLFLVAVAGSWQTGALQEAQQTRILALENAWNQAVMQKDAKAIAPLMDDELIYIDYDGTVMNKGQYLASLRAEATHFEHIQSASMQVQFFGSSAVVVGVYREQGTQHGKPYVRRERFVDTWVNRAGSWICVASESTLITH
jgi:ketosteroid isomerase-like protein